MTDRSMLRRMMAVLGLGILVLGLSAPPVAADGAEGAVPGNDNLGQAFSLPRSGGRFEGSTAGATKQQGERNHAGNRGGASVWFTWRPMHSGRVFIMPAQQGAFQMRVGFL